MRRIMITLSLAVLVMIAATPSAHAQANPCDVDVPNASDMAGLYVSPESQMRVTVYLCGIEALWANDDGTHRAEYTIVEHLHTGVLIGRSFAGPGLDNRMTLGVKPAEPGYIEAFTMSPFMTDLRIYRLRKIS